MSYLEEIELGDSFGPFVAFRKGLGFVPRLLRAQSLLPRVIEAQAKLESATRLKEEQLSRLQKERILLCVAAARHDAYCVSIHGEVLSSLGLSDDQIEGLLCDYHQGALPPSEVALLDFCVQLGCDAPSVRSADIEAIRSCGFADEIIQEAVVVTALAVYRHAISVGLGPEPEFRPWQLPTKQVKRTSGTTPRETAAHFAAMGEKEVCRLGRN